MKLSDVPTPALVLDRGVLRRNAGAMAARMRRHGVALRPHLKTAKSAPVARIATAGDDGGITVSTLQEAEYFAERGFRDLTYAVGILPDRLERAAALIRAGARLRLLTDDAGVARAIGERAPGLGVDLDVLVEVDCGQHRSGVDPGGPDLLEIATILHRAPRVTLAGVLTHAGHSYHVAGPHEVPAIAEQERRAATTAAARLRGAGLPCPVVSAGSTPTAVHARSLDGITEMRPGNYLFFDLFQESIGSCRREDLALTVLGTVIGSRPGAGHVLVDTGSLALSTDTSANAHLPVGHGLVLDLFGDPIQDGLKVDAVNQEHGFVRGEGRLPLDRLTVGRRIRVLPNHACITAAMHDRYHVVDGGDDVVDVWERTNRW